MYKKLIVTISSIVVNIKFLVDTAWFWFELGFFRFGFFFFPPKAHHVCLRLLQRTVSWVADKHVDMGKKTSAWCSCLPNSKYFSGVEEGRIVLGTFNFEMNHYIRTVSSPAPLASNLA